MRETRQTVCNRDCPDACSMVATVEDGRVIQLQGDKQHPVTRGFLCHRTSRFLARQYSPERITTPLLRQGEQFVPVAWDQALDLAAEKLQAICDQSGPAAILHYRSGGSLGLLVMMADRFFEAYGPVTTKRGDICSGAGDAAQMMDFGEEDSHDLSDLLNARHIILWGKNPFVSNVHAVPFLKDAKARGAQLVLIDPVHTRTASLCDAYHAPRPGSDVALAMAVARVLFESGWVDPEAAAYCDNVDAFRKLALARPLAQWCQQADVHQDVATDLARRLHQGPTAILVGWGMQRRVNGAAIVRTLDALAALSGNLGIPGGGVSFYFKRRGAYDTSSICGKADAPRTVCEITLGQDILQAQDPPIRAVWITAGNPVAMLPDSNLTQRALATREFVVVADAFMTDTARLAHLVLPTPTLLEADDLVGAYGHHYLGAATPVVPPPPEVRSDLEIMQGLAKRLGHADAMAGNAREWKRRLLSPKVTSRGVTLEQIEAGNVRNPLSPKVLFEDRKFATPSGKVNLMDRWPDNALGLPDDPTRPLFLMSCSTDKSQSSQWAAPLEGPLEVRVHPDVAVVADGATAVLESERGKLTVVVRHDARQRRDVALVPKGGHLDKGHCANALVAARVTDLGEGAALYDQRVRLLTLHSHGCAVSAEAAVPVSRSSGGGVDDGGDRFRQPFAEAFRSVP